MPLAFAAVLTFLKDITSFAAPLARILVRAAHQSGYRPARVFPPPHILTNLVLLPAMKRRRSAQWVQALARSSSSFPSQAMRPPPAVAGASQKAAIGAAGTMEETMRVRTITELMRLTRIELCQLAARIANELPFFPEGSVDRVIAEANLRNIRFVLARRDFSP